MQGYPPFDSGRGALLAFGLSALGCHWAGQIPDTSLALARGGQLSVDFVDIDTKSNRFRSDGGLAVGRADEGGIAHRGVQTCPRMRGALCHRSIPIRCDFDQRHAGQGKDAASCSPAGRR